jgi:hypothetical protein
MKHKKKENEEPHLQIVYSAAIDERIEAVVLSKMALAEEHIVTRLVERLNLPSDKIDTSPPSTAPRKFFDPLAGP